MLEKLSLNVSSFPRAIKFVGLFFACAFFAHYFAMSRIQNTPYSCQASLAQLLDGTAPGPFQYRALFPWIMNAIRSRGWFADSTESIRELCYIIDFLFTYALFVVMWLYLSLFIRSSRIKAFGCAFR